MSYVLDACALIAYLKKETEGIKVKELLDKAIAREITLYMNRANLIEVYYGYIQQEGSVEKADTIMQSVYDLPMQFVDTITEPIYHAAARFKGLYSISFADAFAAATAFSMSSVLVTKDHEFEPLEQTENLSIFWIT
jgi:predicted nucleic acid-binding protein